MYKIWLYEDPGTEPAVRIDVYGITCRKHVQSISYNQFAILMIPDIKSAQSHQRLAFRPRSLIAERHSPFLYGGVVRASRWLMVPFLEMP